jgi:tripartite-type tricarboxylate transporter receptor subunit TctC
MNHINASGLQAISSSPQDFVKTIRDDMARFSVIIKAAGIVPE